MTKLVGFFRRISLVIIAISMANLAFAQSAAPKIGPESNLPIPRFVSMKAAEANVRRGPSKSHRIDWVFKHRHMPLIVTGEYGHWRRVQDRDGFGGWVHYVLLSGSRSVIIETEEEPLRRKPLEDSPIVAYAQEGVIARLKECSGDWCRITAGKRTGWVKADALWGVSITDAMLGE